MGKKCNPFLPIYDRPGPEDAFAFSSIFLYI